MECENVTDRTTLPISLSAKTKDEFNAQYREMLESSQDIEKIVYVFRSELPIPRLKGESPVIYIGKANGSLFKRYRSLISKETETFWDRYDYIMNNYGKILIDIYKTNNPAITENKFLYDYHKKYLEAPPLNTQSYRTSML
ncbi:MAG TPA: hypothetical protein ENG78_04930 [Acidiferrobacteraceae bacterium]|nr:hypothetical protein [Acidiferrobacteraceae bacterium]HEX20145.1 hypothetical protein [Acidiferrobacteraceae bacterium]